MKVLGHRFRNPDLRDAAVEYLFPIKITKVPLCDYHVISKPWSDMVDFNNASSHQQVLQKLDEGIASLEATLS